MVRNTGITKFSPPMADVVAILAEVAVFFEKITEPNSVVQLGIVRNVKQIMIYLSINS